MQNDFSDSRGFRDSYYHTSAVRSFLYSETKESPNPAQPIALREKKQKKGKWNRAGRWKMPAMPGMLGGLSYRLIEASIMRNDRFDRSTDMKPLPLIRKIWEANRVDDVKKNFDRRSSPRLLVELFFLSSHSTIILPPPPPPPSHLRFIWTLSSSIRAWSTWFPLGFPSNPLLFILYVYFYRWWTGAAPGILLDISTGPSLFLDKKIIFFYF